MRALPAIFFLSVLASPLMAVTVYTETFESEAVGPEWTGVTDLSITGGLSAFGFEALHLHNSTASTTTLSLLGLPQHDSVTVNFHLAMWDSIDLGSDQFVITGGGQTLYNSSTDFGNYFPGDNVGHGPGTLLTEAFTAFAIPDYGQNSGFRDSARLVSFTFPHTGESIAFTWQFPNSQGGTDESFGLDNVTVSVTGVPEPSAALLLTGTLAALLRRRRA
jgi:hypothetical protein